MPVKYSVHNEGFVPDTPDTKRNGVVAIQINGHVADKKPTMNGGFDGIEHKHAPAEEQRDGWGNKIEFLLAIIGYAVGLGNVWRFPYLAQKNGGGAFIIPYILSLILMGVPVFLLELSVGQRLRKGPIHVWHKLSPMLSGVGISSIVVSFLVGCYYNMIVAWCFYYLFISFQKTVPYSSCPETMVNGSYVPVAECGNSSATEYYWYRVALNSSDSIDESGGLNWKLCLCLLLAWAVLFGITCKGVESMGKVIYFTALFPYVVLIIFFIRAMMLKGAAKGIEHLFVPKFEKLLMAETWLDAATQIFYSLGLAFGGLISMSSYNPINNNVMRDAILVSCVNCGTSVFAGIVIFGILGYKANIKYEACLAAKPEGGCDLNYFLDNVAEGPGLTFIAFTEAMSTMEVQQLWSVMFFLMLLTLGIGSMLGTFEAVRTSVVDLNLLPFRKEIVCLILCIASYLFGLLFCQRSGEYWLQMFNTYSASIGLLTIALIEIVIVMYVYGLKKFKADIHFMLGKTPNYYWVATWFVIAPVLLSAIIIASLYELFSKGITYDAWNRNKAKVVESEYPDWGVALCFILVAASVVCIPIVAVLVKFDLYKIPNHDKNRRPSALPEEENQ